MDSRRVIRILGLFMLEHPSAAKAVIDQAEAVEALVGTAITYRNDLVEFWVSHRDEIRAALDTPEIDMGVN